MSRRAAIWPLKPGLDAFNALGAPMKTQLGVRAYMDLNHARNLEAQGHLQLLVGKRPQELIQPRDIKVPPDLDSVVDEDPPARPLRKKVAARRAYKRRDMAAED